MLDQAEDTKTRVENIDIARQMETAGNGCPFPPFLPVLVPN